MLLLSHVHLCSEHFAECDFVNFIAEYLMGFASKRNLYSCPQGSYKIPIRISKDEPDEQQAHSMIPNIERYTDTLKPARQNLSKAKTKSLTRMLTQKRPWKKETVHKCLWQRKKVQTTNAGGKQKMAALISQANGWHQMKETKQLKPPQNPKRLPTCKHKAEKTHTTNHNSLIDYCLQQRSGRLQSEEHRAQSKNNCANDKQMESQTNSKLPPH